MEQLKLEKILSLHSKWLFDGTDGVKADLTDADLTGANLTGAYLTGADLTGAYLTDADLTCADLTDANLTDAKFTGADLDYSCLPLWCGSLGAKFDKKHYIQLLYHILKSLESNDLIDDEFKKSLLTTEVVEIANKFHRADECGKLNK